MQTLNITLKDLKDEILSPINYYQETFKRGFYMTAHTHGSFEIMYCLEGAFTIEATDSDKIDVSHVEVDKNHFIFINTNCQHKLVVDTVECRILNIEFMALPPRAVQTNVLTKRFLLSAEEMFSLNPSWQKIRKENNPFYLFYDKVDVAGDIISLINECTTYPPPPESEPLSAMLVIKLFTDIARCAYDKNLFASGIVYLKKAVQYIRQNFTRKLKIDDLAAACGISTAYLQRLFKQELNKTFHTVITEVRLEHAKHLLAETRLNNAEIANLSGFNSRQRMIDIFKAFENCTPDAYRKSMQQKNIRHWIGVNVVDAE